jgi:nucleoid-associated protein YgaU
MIEPMTERGLPIVDGAPACPFVAFEDDRDERAASPDHRHRCYAEARPAPRALAHQEAYCLSSAFPVCPTFQDWARREAAHSRADGPRTPEGATVVASDQPQRNPPRNWSAPPPWAGRGEPPPDDWVDDGGRGLSGSYADRVASGTEVAGMPAPDLGPDQDDDGSLGLAAAAAAPIADAGTGAGAFSDGPAVQPPSSAAPPPVDAPSASAAAQANPGGEPPRRRRDANAPEWERARPLEVYPTLRARRLPELSVPPLLVAVVAVALAAAVLFALPGLLGFGSPQVQSSPSPSPLASTTPASIAPTLVPEPTQVTYIVQSGDTMSKIAKRFHVTLDDLIAANRETIPNPDQLQIGDLVIIPVPQASSLPAASP